MKKVFKVFLIIIIIFITAIIGVNLYVVLSSKNRISVLTDIEKIENIDCIVVLGAGIWGDEPSPMLKDRLDVAIDLYKKGIAPKIIMSGDHSRENYDEVNIMKSYAINAGVPSEDIFMDHAGFSTYETIYRTKEIFKAKKIIIVTQKYHLYRSLYISNKLDVEAYGVGADPRKYSNQLFREIREILARDKDFIKCIFKPSPTYLGDSIPVSGDGNITNDKEDSEVSAK